MGKQVTVTKKISAPGVPSSALYTLGATVILSDAQYAELAPAVLACLSGITTVADPTPPAAPVSVGASPWTEHALSVDLADYDDDGVGTWTSDGTTLSQTDPLVDAALWLKTPLPSLLYAVEAQVLLASGQNAGVTAVLAVTAGGTAPDGETGLGFNQGEGFSIERTDLGDAGDVGIAAFVDGGKNSALFHPGIAADQWNTVRAVVSPFRHNIYFNGNFLFANEELTGGNGASPASGFGGADLSTDRVGISAFGLGSFRNVKVWTLTQPA